MRRPATSPSSRPPRGPGGAGGRPAPAPPRRPRAVRVGSPRRSTGRSASAGADPALSPERQAELRDRLARLRACRRSGASRCSTTTRPSSGSPVASGARSSSGSGDSARWPPERRAQMRQALRQIVEARPASARGTSRTCGAGGRCAGGARPGPGGVAAAPQRAARLGPSSRARPAPPRRRARSQLALAAPRAAARTRTQATLHLRHAYPQRPSTRVLFDRGPSTFDVGGYLEPELGRAIRIDCSRRCARGEAPRRRPALGARGRHRRGPPPRLPAGSRWSAGCAPTAAGRADGARAQGRPAAAAWVALTLYPLEETRLAAPIWSPTAGRFGTRWRRTLLVREAYAAWSFGRARFATVRAGASGPKSRDGYVHDDYATGVELEARPRRNRAALGPLRGPTSSRRATSRRP